MDAQFWTNLNTAVTGSTFLLASELAAFQAVASTYGLNRAQAATYFVAVILSTDPTSLGLSTAANPANPNGLSDQQTYINQFNAATNRAIVSGNYANQSASASNLNYPVVGPAANPGYVGGVNAESGVNNLTASVVTAENSIAVAAAANNPALIPNVPAPGTTFQLTTGVDAPGTGAFAFGSPAGNSTVFGAFNGGTATFTPGDNIQATGAGNVFNLTDNSTGGSGNVNSVAATVSGINNLTAYSGEALLANTTTWSGLTQINATTASVGGLAAATPTTITAGAATDVNISDTAATGNGGNNSGGGVTVNGGRNVVVTEKGSTATASAIAVGGTTAASGTITATATAVTTAAPGNTTITVNGGTTVTVSQGQTGNVTVGNTTAPTGAVTVTNTGGTGTVSIQGGASATVTETTLTAGYSAGKIAVTSGVSGASVINVSATNVVSNSNTSAAISVTGGTGATITTTGANSYTGSTVSAGYIFAGSADTNTPTILPIAGSVSITDNFSGQNKDIINVYNTGSATISTTRSSGTITVGTATAAQNPTGAVTINNSSATNGKTFYGTGNVVVNVNGASTVSITGGSALGGNSLVRDYAATNALSTVNLTGLQGTGNAITLTSTALTTVNINNSTLLNPNNVAITGTIVTVSNSTSGHTLAVGLNGNTANTTALTDANAKIFNVTATGTTANNITLTAGYNGAHTYNLVNNGTATLTLNGITDTNGATGGVFTVGGTGAVNLGTVFSGLGATNYATLNASANTGGVTATVLGTQNFTGGSGNNVITVTSNAAILTNINGGTGTNNTLIATSAAANYATGLGGSLTGFQNLEVQGNAITGSYSSAAYGGVLVSGLTATQVSAGNGNSATFSSLASGTKLTVLDQAAQSSATSTIASAANGQTFIFTINGKSYTATGDGVLTASDLADAIRTAYTAAPINGVTLSGGGTAAVTVTGANTFATSGTGTINATNTLSGVATYSLAATPAAATGNTLPLTLNSATGSASVLAQVAEAGNQTITINSVLDASVKGTTLADTNTVRILDTSTSANANGATSLTISGGGNATVYYDMSYAAGTAANALATINAGSSSGAVNVSSVAGKTTGITITGGSGLLTATLSGAVTGQTAANFYGAVDTVTAGSGGATVNLGSAGLGVNSGSGTQTINLAASLTAADTINSTAAGQHAIVTSFKNINTSKADVINVNGAGNARILDNVTTGTAVPAGTGVGANTYTVSNGIITFSGPDTGLTLLADAEAIVNASAYRVAAYQDGSDTYVVYNTVNGAGAIATDTVVKLTGVTGVTGFGYGTGEGSSNTIKLSTALAGTPGTTGLASAAQGYSLVDSSTAAFTQNDAGNFEQYYTGATAGAKVYNNLGSYAQIDSASTGTAAGYTLSTTQTGAAGTNYLTFNALDTQTIAQVNMPGDWGASFNTTNAKTLTITSLVDTGNTLSTINIGGGTNVTASGATYISAITDTALTSINIAAYNGVVHLGTSSAALSQNGLVVTSLTTGATANVFYLSGANAKIDLSAVTTGSANAVYSATGTGSTILGGIGATGETLIVGANGTVTMAQGTAAAGSINAVNGDTNANLITVGANSVVNLGTTSAGAASDGGSTIKVWGDTVGTIATPNFVTVNNIVDSSTKIDFVSGNETGVGFVNVAAATSLSNAFDLAVTQFTNGGAAGTTYAGWMQYGGNTYVIAHTGVAETALSANDLVVKITGLYDLPNFTVGAQAEITL